MKIKTGLSVSKELLVSIRVAIDTITTRNVFFAPTLLRHELSITDDVPTACVDGKANIQLGVDFVSKLRTQQLVFLLAHECLHAMLGHPFRRGGRDPAKWNWAGDAFINETLIRSGIGEFIEGGVRYAGAHEMTTDELYALAPDDPDGGGGGSLGSDLDSSVDGMSQEELADAVEKANSSLAQAAMAAKSCGSLPATLQDMVDAVLHVPTPWYDLLANYMTRRADVDYDWTTPDIYLLEHDVYVPDLGGVGAGEVVVVADESGSISSSESAAFFGQFKQIMRSCHPEKIYVLHTSTRVADVSTFRPENLPAEMPRKTSGGTDMEAGIAYAEEHYPQADAVVVLTDGYTPFRRDSTKLPVFWLITTPSKTAPYGTTIHCDLSEAT